MEELKCGQCLHYDDENSDIHGQHRCAENGEMTYYNCEGCPYWEGDLEMEAEFKLEDKFYLANDINKTLFQDGPPRPSVYEVCGIVECLDENKGAVIRYRFRMEETKNIEANNSLNASAMVHKEDLRLYAVKLLTDKIQMVVAGKTF